jgi:hypothetical protein
MTQFESLKLLEGKEISSVDAQKRGGIFLISIKTKDDLEIRIMAAVSQPFNKPELIIEAL